MRDILEALFEHQFVEPPASRYEWLCETIFDIATYDSEMSELIGRKAVEVCKAISTKTTYEYISDPENYRWYILLCNMPFFADRIEWGTSIRGAWWQIPVGHVLTQCMHVDSAKYELIARMDNWDEFITALCDFAENKVENDKNRTDRRSENDKHDGGPGHAQGHIPV